MKAKKLSKLALKIIWEIIMILIAIILVTFISLVVLCYTALNDNK